MLTQPDLFGSAPKPRRHHSEGQRRKRDGQFANLISKAPWHADALAFLRKWLRKNKKDHKDFTMEPFKAWALANGLDEPWHPNCWGTVTSAANTLGLIEWTGRFDVAKSPKAHGRAIRVWTFGINA